MSEEEWRPVVGWEGIYEVSNLGRVKSLARMVAVPNRWGGVTGRHQQERIISLRSLKGRYWLIDLKEKSRGNKTTYVHRLVCEAFHGPAPEGCEVAHFDGDGLNNRAENLRWASHSDNQLDRRRHGTNQAVAKVPPEDVPAIRALTDAKRDRELAAKYGVRAFQIRNIRRGTARVTDGYQAPPQGHNSLRGGEHPNAKLTEREVLEIRRLRLAGQTYSALAKTYGVNKSLIAKIVTLKAWKHI